MVVSPSSSHSFGVSVVWNDIVVVGELFLADGTLSVLFDDPPVQELTHLAG